MANHETSHARDRPVTLPYLSVIVPLYNEEDSVGPLCRAVLDAVEPLKKSFELILVDDGSADRTFHKAKQLATADGRIRVIKFRRNYGQTPAMVAGIEHARGEVLVTMDGDLQNDPADIAEMLGKIEDGYDIVVGWRQRRQDRYWSRIVPSKIANWLIAQVTGVPIKDNGCSLKAYRAALIKNIPLYSEMHRFIPAMTSLAGAKIAQMPVRHHARRYGTSKYGISRTYRVLLDLLAIKSVLLLAANPLFSFTWSAATAFALGMGLLGYDLTQALWSGSFSYVILGLSLLFGVLAIFLLSLGLLAQIVYKTGNLKTADLSALTAVDEGDSVHATGQQA